MVVTDNNTTLNTVHHPHYRIVLKETGNWKPLLEADRLSQVTVMLDDLVQALHNLHLANPTSWEQQEISPANILLSRDGVGKLVDWDLAETSTDRIRDVRQGPSCFMPIEVARKTCRFFPSEVVIQPFFRCNFLHQLESVWWLTTWMLLSHYPVPNVTIPIYSLPQASAVGQFFDNCHCRSTLDRRTDIICQNGKFGTIVADLHVDVRPYWNKLDKLRSSLLEAYSNFEARLAGLGVEKHIATSSVEVSDGIYNDFRLTFQAMTKELESKDIPLIHLNKLKYSPVQASAIKPFP